MAAETPFPAVHEASRVQRAAADPARSVALRASAGSGKTKVLVDRFLRLCIEGGGERVHPRSILAITFTRKAAVEIQERLLERAETMALATAEELRAQLAALFADRPGPAPTSVELERAAGLHELVLEDLSGLNVGTIHSFCQLILNRFAVEAGLDPRFTVLENRQELVDEALDRLELAAVGDPALGAAAQAVAGDPAAVRSALQRIFGEQMRIERWLKQAMSAAGTNGAPRRRDALPFLLRDLKAFLFPDLDPDSEPNAAGFLPALAGALEAFAGPGLEAVAAADIEGLPAKDLDRLREKAKSAAATVRDAMADPGGAGACRSLFQAAADVFLTKDGKARAFTRIRKDAALKERFHSLVCEQALPVLEILRTAGRLDLYATNRGLLELGLTALDLYDELKRRDRVVDFQDLEELACRLMGDEARALTLLYRLDDSISHILLDEFQDTNFNQWEILQPFVADFLAGGSGDGRPTVFFVGDGKQSIYSFRGAEPDLLAAVENELESRAETAVLNLPTNFRSLPAIVRGVNCLFVGEPIAADLDRRELEQLRQEPARDEATGAVYVLEPYADEEEETGRGGSQVGADAAAWLARDLVDRAETTWEGFGADRTERPLVWGDFLVLCRQRTDISLYEKAFREAGIPTVPSGRGMLAASREVQDIQALLRWLVWPDDDVALATALRSPLFRLDEAALQTVLARRGLRRPGKDGRFASPRGIWRTIQNDAEDRPVTGPVVKRLHRWRKLAGFENCHDLLRRIYREGEVLERFQAALGDQARYNLLRLFDLAQGPEMAATPTLRRMVELIERADRQGGQDEGTLPRSGAEGRVRFLTIHGAKGLEAPVVILADADRPAGRESPRIRIRSADRNSPLVFQATAALRRPYVLHGGVRMPEDGLQNAAAEALLRARREEANLLYVAMTRARDRLFVLGGDKERGRDFDSPLRRLRRGAQESGCETVDLDDPPGLERPPAPAARPARGERGSEASNVGEEIRTWRRPVLRPRFTIETPSAGTEGTPASVSGAAPVETPVQRPDDRSPHDRRRAIARGNRVHLLLQAACDLGTMPPRRSADWDEAAAVFNDPELSWVFHSAGPGEEDLSEAPLIQSLAETKDVPRRITGAIDRLILRPGRADIVDYKTNRLGGVPVRQDELVAHYRPQLEAYRAAVTEAVPDRTVRAWLLFTDPDLPAGLPRLREVE